MASLNRLQERYDNDVTFRSLVSLLEGTIEGMRLTPSEVRDAAMYACVRIESRRFPMFILDTAGGEIRMASDEELAAYRAAHEAGL